MMNAPSFHMCLFTHANTPRLLRVLNSHCTELGWVFTHFASVIPLEELIAASMSHTLWSSDNQDVKAHPQMTKTPAEERWVCQCQTSYQ